MTRSLLPDRLEPEFPGDDLSGRVRELRRLRGVAVALPFVFLVAYSLVVRGPAYAPFHTRWGFFAIMVLLGLLVLAFATWVFRIIEQQQRLILHQHEQVRRLGEHLRALDAAALAIASEDGLATALGKIVDVSRSLFDAAHAGLVIVEQGEIRDLVTEDVPGGQAGTVAAHLGPELIGRILACDGPVRVGPWGDCSDAECGGISCLDLGFPPLDACPRMVLATPLRYQGTLLGALYLTGRDDGQVFDQGDERLLQGFAAQAAIALHAVRLYREVQTLATEKERQWIAREMHDGVAQVLAYVNVKAQAISEFLHTGQAEQAQAHLGQLAEAARRVYADVREGILGLRIQLAGEERSLAQVVSEYLHEFELESNLTVRLAVNCPGGRLGLDPLQEVQVLRIIQEALTNTRKHAQATEVEVRLVFDDVGFSASVADDGQGFDPARTRRPGRPCFGLQTMQERAESVGGVLHIDSAPGRGSVVSVTVPSGMPLEVLR